VKGFNAPLRLRSLGGESSRRVTWLELFFDLVFVAAVAQVAAPLQTDYSLAGLIRFTPLFALTWWAWTGHSVFSTRFDSDDVVQRTLTLVQMFAVAAMAANAKDALDARSSAGFAAAYAIVRFLLVAQYFRARRVPDAGPLTTRYLAGHGSAAVLWLGSAFVPAPARFWIWALAFAIDLGTPWLAVPHSIRVPPDAAHLPERFGLFTLILLGESVVGVMRGMESQEDWPPSAAASAFLGMAIAFLIWWWYFDGALGASDQPVRSRREAVRFHIWSYAHFPLYLGIVVAGAGVERIVTAASKHALTEMESLILAGAVATVMAAMTAIDRTSAGHRRDAGSGIVLRSMVLAAATLAIGVSGRFTVPVLLIATLASLCALQLVLSLRARVFAVAPVVAVVVLVLLPGAAFAEPEKKFAADGRSRDDMQTDAGVGRLRLRPLMGGVSYTWIKGKLSVSPRLIAGYSFNRFSGTESVSAHDSFVSKAELQIWRDLSSRVGVLCSIGYLFARPEVSGRTINADAIRVQVGIAYAVF
jgi:low temperature requirement protein LtrA